MRGMAPSGPLKRAQEAILAVAAAAVDLLVWSGDSHLRSGHLLPVWVLPAMAAIVYPILVLRWRCPRAVFATHWTYGLAGLLFPLYAPFSGLLVALYALARRCPGAVAGMALVLCSVPFGVSSYNLAATATEGHPVANFVVAITLWSALTALVWGGARLALAAEQRSEREKRAQAAAAVRAERLHLARELHDIVSHAVSTVILQAAGAQTVVGHDEKQVRVALEAIEAMGVQAMGELHQLLGLLRAATSEDVGDDPSPQPSLRDLNILVGSVRSSGVGVEVRVEGDPVVLNREVDLAAYRVVQEALTNTIKHAGQEASARILLDWDAQGLGLTIQDTAKPIPRKTSELPSGYGLAGLAERVTRVGGTLEARPTSDGFLIQAYLPARQNNQQQKASVPISEDLA